MRTPRWLAALVCAAALALVTAPLPCQELSWVDNPTADGAPPGFTLHTDGSGKPAARTIGPQVALTCEVDRSCHIDAPLTMEGTDDAPLRAECSLWIDHGPALQGGPLFLALSWSSGALLAVGECDGGGERQGDRWANHPCWGQILGGKTTITGVDMGLYAGASIMHVRLVVASSTISGYASADGWNWARIAAWPRTSELHGPPARLILGRGWGGGGGGKAAFDEHPPGSNKAPPATYHIGYLSVAAAQARVPADLMKSYEKGDSREDTIDAIDARGKVRDWQLLGPLPANTATEGLEASGAQEPLKPIGKLAWKHFNQGDSVAERVLALNQQLPGVGENAVCLAVATINAPEARWERFILDGTRDLSVFLNGVEIVRDWHDAGLSDDRLGACGWLAKGDNRLVVRLGAGRGGLAALMMRHERGDPLYAIALGQRLAIDFPDDGGSSFATLLDTAHAWENLGFQRQAAKALEEAAKSQDATPQQIDDALTERTRLDRELADDARVQSDIDELTKRWSDASDPVGAQIKVAHLWERMGLTQKAADALSAALAASKDPAMSCEIALERGTIHHRLADPSGEISDWAAAAAAVPATDPRHADLLATLALAKLRVKSDPAAVLAEATASANPGTLRRIVAIQALRGDKPGELAALDRLIALDPDRLDQPLFTRANLAIEAKQLPEAEKTLQTAIMRLPGAQTERIKKRLAALPAKPEDAVPALRGIAVEAWLCGSDDGLAALAFYDHPADTAELPSEIPTWQIIGSFACENWRTWTGEWLKSVGCDPANPNFGKPIEGKRWKKIGIGNFNNGVLDLAAFYASDRNQNCMAMLCTSVTCDKPTDVQFSCGADDALNVWVNGVEVYTDMIQRGCSPDSIPVFAKFRKGRNVILVQVQQGGGAWGVQFRIVNGKAGAGIVDALKEAIEQSGGRDASAQALENAATSLMRANRNGQAHAIARALLGTYPDQPEIAFDCAAKAHGNAYNCGDGGMIMDIEDWAEASPAVIRGDRDNWQTAQRWQAAEWMHNWQRLRLGVELLQSMLDRTLEPSWRAETLRRLGDAYLGAGDVKNASLAYNRALGVGETNGDFLNAVHQGLRAARPPKGAHESDTAFEIDNVMRTGERAIAAKDAEHAIAVFQKAIDEDGTALCQTADGRLLSTSAYAAECLRTLDANDQALYAAHYEGAARGLLTQAIALDDLDGCERVASSFPLTKAAGDALAAAARGYAGRGAWGLAAGTWQKLLHQHQLSDADATADAVAMAAEAARAGERALFAEARGLLSGAHAAFPAGTSAAQAKAWLDSLEKDLPQPDDRRLPADLHAVPMSSFPVLPDDLADLMRVDWQDGPQPLFMPTLAGGEVLVSSISGARAIDLATGATRWRDYAEFPNLRYPQRWGDYQGLPECQAATAGGLCLARVLRANIMCIEARRLSDGSLAWSSEQGALRDQGWWITSSPAAGEDRVYVCLAKDDRSAVAALDISDGRLLWLTVVSGHRAAIPMLGHEFRLDGYVAPPLVSGRRVYVALDQGVLFALDGGDGEIAWAARYPRAQLRPEDQGPTAVLGMRSPTRVLAAGEDRLVIAPRDALGVYGFATDGTLAWSLPALPARHVSSISPDGLTAIADWLFLQAIDTRSGALRWRFSPWPNDGQFQGHALVSGGEVLAETDHALYRVSLATGALISRQSWDELGVPGRYNLFMGPQGLYGLGNGQLVSFGGGKPAKPPPAISGVERDTDIPTSNLAAVADSPQMAVDWALGGDSVRSIDQPEGTPAGCCFVRFARSLAYLDVAKHRVIWRIRLAVDTRFTRYLEREIVSVQRNGAIAYDRETGAMKWQTQFAESVLDALRGETPERYIAVDQTLMSIINRQSIWVFSTQDGHRIGSFDWDGNPLCVTEYQGKVWLCGRRGSNITVDVRDPAALGAIAINDQILGLSDRDGACVDGTSIIAHTRSEAVRYDLATRKTHPFPYVGDAYNLRRFDDSPGFEVSYVHDFADHWMTAVLDKDDKVVFAEHSQDGGWPMENRLIWDFQLHGNRLLRFDLNRNNREGVLCRSFPDGKELWRADGRAWNTRRDDALVVLGGHAFTITFEYEGGALCHAIDLASGHEVAAIPVPGWQDERVIPAIAIAGGLLYGTDLGLVRLIPVALDARNPQNGAADLWHAEPIDVSPAAEPITIDGHLDDWKGIEAHELRDPADAGSGGGGASPSRLHGSVGLCYDGDGVYAAVRVDDPDHHSLAPGACALSGDNVRFAIDPLAAPWHGAGQLVLDAAVVGGTTRLWVNGSRDLPGPVHAAARAAIDANGMTYEFFVPWGYLRGDGSKRPGDQKTMTVGVLITKSEPDDSPRALELGWGLAGAWDPIAWWPVYFHTPDEASLTGIAFTLSDGRAEWGPAGLLRAKPKAKEEPWLVDSQPKNAVVEGEGLTWDAANKPPGAKAAHDSGVNKDPHQHYLTQLGPYAARRGDKVYAWIWLDPAHTPHEVMIQVFRAGSWEHRAYWGDDRMGWGADNSPSRHPMGALPAAGGWVRLEIPVDDIDLR